MITMYESEVTCALCGTVSKHATITSTNMLTSPDLDTRPGIMMRNTISTWVQECPQCGYCSENLSEGSKIEKQWLSLLYYRDQLLDRDYPELANRFLCSSTLLELSTSYVDAAWRAIHAAWACDDENRTEAARKCRMKAISLISIAGGYKQHLSDEAEDTDLIKIDLLRRCGEFEMAKQIADKLAGELSVEVKKAVTTFQSHLAGKKDDRCHTIEDAEQFYSS